MTRNLLQFIARPTGPSLPRTTYEAFMDMMRSYSVDSLVAGFNTFAWKAWKDELPTFEANALSGATAPVLAAYALAVGSTEPNARIANFGNIIDLHFHHLAIDSIPRALLDLQERAIAKLVSGTDLAFLLPDLRAARVAAIDCIMARVHRAQLLPQRSTLDELSKTWWIARRLDADADQIARAEQMLGMQVPVFVRAASALLAFAVTHDPAGCVFIERNIEPEFLEKYDVDQDVLRLAAHKLSTTRSDLQQWISDVEARFPDGAKHFVPTPLLTTPLLKLELGSGPPYACPSVPHFISAVRDRVREAISQPGRTEADTADLYGDHLVKYVLALAHAAGANVVNLDSLERRTRRRADLLFTENDRGLIVEIKRSLAPGALSRHLLYPEGIVAVLEHLLGAFRQCQASYWRRPWDAEGMALSKHAAVILVDEPVGAEGGVFADLLGQQTQVDLPFEVMSVTDFENALGVLGVQALTDLIRQKWDDNLRDLPLAIYAKNVRKLQTRSVTGKRTHLEAEDRELFFETGMATQDFAAQWP